MLRHDLVRWTDVVVVTADAIRGGDYEEAPSYYSYDLSGFVSVLKTCAEVGSGLLTMPNVIV